MADSEERPIPFRAAREARPSSCKDGPTAKVGRPKVTITEDVLERRRLSKRRQNARRNIQQGAPPTGILNVSSRGIPPPGQSSSQLDATDGGEASNAEEDLHMDNSAEGSGLEQGSGVDNVAGGQADPGSGETRRQRASINRKKKEFNDINVVLNMGMPTQTCGSCQAQVWAEEFTGRHVGAGARSYSICCGKGKVQLPLLRVPPSELTQLLTGDGMEAKMYYQKSRVYNTMFAFCSFGGKVDESINKGRGPYVFRVTGQVCHNIGSLVPPERQTPKFAQLYMYDGYEANEHRINYAGRKEEVDRLIVTTLDSMLTSNNVLVGIFRQIRQRFAGMEVLPVRLKLFERRRTDGRFHNSQSQDDYEIENIDAVNPFEFAALAVDNDFANKRDIVIHSKAFGLQHISELHPCYMSLQYPLLFPFGEDGYRTGIKHRNVDISDNRRNNTVSMREYYAFRTHFRVDEGHALILGGRLYLQFLVDAWCSVERSRLLWVQRNQSLIRSDLYNSVVDSFRRGDTIATDVGKRVILLSSFTGGYRYMQQNFQDSLAICKEYGHPDLFITFTCNPKWEEIEAAVQLSSSHDASVRPDVSARVFKMKLDAMMADFTKHHVMGRVLAAVYTIEFQKRGLPHAHIVLWLAEADKITNPAEIDSVISAEIPDRLTDPVGYKAVSQFMMHGPCGSANPKCPCMVKGRCSKYFPKSFADNTVIDADGYAQYRRRDSKQNVKCGKVFLDNRHVVPYHRGLLVKYQGHINVEWCNRSLAIKYLFKYIGKGPDMATVVLEREHRQLTPVEMHSTHRATATDRDEVKTYVSCRYVSAAEASWRLYEFPIHHREPFVQRLYFHLENEQEVRFRDDETLPQVVRRIDPDGTMFIQWMLTNRYDELGRDLTFVKFPTKFRWDSSARRWFRRKQNIDVVGRMVYAHPASGERFYMRLLLNIVQGAMTFEDIRKVEGIVHPTYKDACFHRGLLESDNEWHIALEDANAYATGPQLRDLFVTLLVFCEVSNPAELWERHWPALSDDIEYTQRKLLRLPSLRIDVGDKQMLALQSINDLLKQYGKKVGDYPGLPAFNPTTANKYRNELLVEEMLYDRETLRVRAENIIRSLNPMQSTVFQRIIQAVDLNLGGLYFVYGPGGTGKTFLWSAIISKLRSEGRIVLAVASSGIASLLMDGGRTAHSRFKIPINVDEFSCCEIKQNTYLAELICEASLVIWDEAPMTHRHVFEAVDRTFRDIRSKVNPNASSACFGGITMLLGGDFRQVLPVVPKKGREDIVGASISKSFLWDDCTVFNLVENMRIERDVPPVTIDGRKVPFRNWVLALGDGTEQTTNFDNDMEPSWIKIPAEVYLKAGDDPLQTMVNEIYGHLGEQHVHMEYIRDRAILTPLNEYVEAVNNEVLHRLPGELKIYRSYDSICKAASTPVDEVLYPPEYLNSLKFSGLPNHELQVKVGSPIMLLRNLNPKKGLCNGTRLIVTRCYNFLLEARIMTGNKIDDITYIPKINMCPADKTFPAMVKRKQFPIAVCYAMTVNKSQGQTVKNVGLYLPKPVFSHGQIYVAVSRVTSPQGLKILCVDEDVKQAGYTKNIVYHEIFDNLMPAQTGVQT